MDLFRFDPPDPTVDTVRRAARELYGIEGAMRRLRGERSHNTVISVADGCSYILKIASGSESPGTIDFHARALVHIEQVAPELPIARMCRSLDGSLVPRLELDGATHAVRLVTFLPGVTFSDDQSLSDDGLWAIGALLGRIASALADFDDPAADDFMPWDIANGLILDDDLWHGSSPDSRAILTVGRERLEEIASTMRALPRQIIHNDGHAGNLLRVDDRSEIVTGLIDFGDLVRTVTAADIGVAGANLVPHQVDPVGALAALTSGFHAHRPLSDIEIDAVPDLVLARLALSTLLAEHQVVHAPHIADAVAAELPGLRDGLRLWLGIDRARAAERIRERL